MNAEQSEEPLQKQLRLLQMITSMATLLMPPPKRDAGQWADENRVLPPESPEPGPWRTDRVPFWRDIYKAFADDYHETIVVACGAQMSKTEGMFNILGHRFSDGPFVPALYIGPTEKQVKSISKDRIDKMLRSTPLLWERTEKGQRYGMFEKWIAGVRLGFGWAGSATELSSHPAGLVLVDERDRMPADISNEGDPMSLARARTKNYSNRKIGAFSTPTLEGASPIWTLWESGTMMMWAWSCLSCKQWFVPHLAILKWPSKCPPDEALTKAYLECPHCHFHMYGDKHKLNENGKYIQHRKLGPTDQASPTAIWKIYEPQNPPEDKKTASYWISGLASPWVSFGEIAKVMIEAYASGEPTILQTEINTWGGELFRVEGEAPDWSEVQKCRLEYLPKTIPRGTQRLTLGADVQKYGIYYVIRGWGHNSESWLLDQDFIAGETDHDQIWEQLYDVIRAPIGQLRIERALVDSGYRPGDMNRRPDHAVYTFSRRLPGLIFPTKGQDPMDTPFRFSMLDYSFGGVTVKNGIKLMLINSDFFKRWIHARVRWPEGKAGGWHLHNQITEDYCRQIVAEQLVLKASGRATWMRKSRANHYLDCEVNAAAAGLSIGVHKLPPALEPEHLEKRISLPSIPAPVTGHQRHTLF